MKYLNKTLTINTLAKKVNYYTIHFSESKKKVINKLIENLYSDIYILTRDSIELSKPGAGSKNYENIIDMIERKKLELKILTIMEYELNK